MQKVICVWKRVGETPLQAIKEFKKANTEYENESISYAGRLDPMAEGALLLLVGDENKKRKEYEGLKKEYEAEVVLGIATDSFDALGVILKQSDQREKTTSAISSCTKAFIGKQKQKFPPYSSKPVDGKPLYWWSRQNRISEIEIPEKEIEIYSLVLDDERLVTGEELSRKILARVKMVFGDFRQEDIVKQWEKFGKAHSYEKFQVIKLSISCSSGTYIRRLASDIGEKLSCGAFCLSIKRTRVGEHQP